MPPRHRWALWTSLMLSALPACSQTVAGSRSDVGPATGVLDAPVDAAQDLAPTVDACRCAGPCGAQGCLRATALAAGNTHTCALLDDGTVRCWGDNSFGQLGDGTALRRARPVEVSGLRGVRALTAGDFSTCALRDDGTVWCWGSVWSDWRSDVPRVLEGVDRAVQVNQPILSAVAW